MVYHKIYNTSVKDTSQDINEEKVILYFWVQIVPSAHSKSQQNVRQQQDY